MQNADRTYGNEKTAKQCYATFFATHSAQGGPCPPTGRSTKSDHVYIMQFDGDRIRHMTKVWNVGWAMRELGWV